MKPKPGQPAEGDAEQHGHAEREHDGRERRARSGTDQWSRPAERRRTAGSSAGSTGPSRARARTRATARRRSGHRSGRRVARRRAASRSTARVTPASAASRSAAFPTSRASTMVRKCSPTSPWSRKKRVPDTKPDSAASSSEACAPSAAGRSPRRVGAIRSHTVRTEYVVTFGTRPSSASSVRTPCAAAPDSGRGESTSTSAIVCWGKTFWNSCVAATAGSDATTIRSMALSFGILNVSQTAPGASAAYAAMIHQRRRTTCAKMATSRVGVVGSVRWEHSSRSEVQCCPIVDILLS